MSWTWKPACAPHPSAKTSNPVDPVQQVLELLVARLKTSDQKPLNDATLLPDQPAISLLQGQMTITARVQESNPGILHLHVLTVLLGKGSTKQPQQLEACLVGIGDTATEEIANLWFTQVGVLIFSLIAARPLKGADDFHGTEDWGVPERHGFVGPYLVRSEDPLNSEELASWKVFTGIDYPGDNRLHLVKVTLFAKMGGGWQRRVELDGHSASYVDDDFSPGLSGLPAPESGAICTRFALFFNPATM